MDGAGYSGEAKASGSTRRYRTAVYISRVLVVEYLTTSTPGPGHPSLYELHIHPKLYVAFLLDVGRNGDLSGIKSHLVLPSCWSLSSIDRGDRRGKEETQSGAHNCGS